MPYPISDGSIAEVSIEGALNGQNFISLFHYYLEQDAPVTDGAALMQELLTDFVGGMLLAYLDAIPAAVDNMSVYGQWITPLRYRYEIAAGGPFTGGSGQDPFPQNVSVAITKFGQEANRHNIGTLHMPAVPETFIVNGMVSPAGMAVYNVIAGELDDPFTSAAGHVLAPVIFNRAEPSESPYIIGAFTQLTGRVNRRRTVGLGS